MQRGAWGVAVESSCRREATRALKSAVEAVYEEGSATGILSGAHRTGSGRSLGGGVSHDRGAKRIGGRKREEGLGTFGIEGQHPGSSFVEHPGVWNGVASSFYCGWGKPTAPSRAWPCSRPRWK